MRTTQIISGVAIVMAAVACTHNQKETAASGESRIKPSSSTPARDTASEYGNQGSRMGSPTDSSRREQASTPTSGANASTGTTAAQGDANLIGSPAWWRTHLTADGKPRP